MIEKNLKNKLNNLQEIVIKIEATIKGNNKYIENSVPADKSLPINNANLESYYNKEIKVPDKGIEAKDRKKRINSRKKPKDPLLENSTVLEISSKNRFLYNIENY